MQHLRWWLGGLSDDTGDLLAPVKDWLEWQDRDKVPFSPIAKVTDLPQVPQTSLRPTADPHLHRLFPIMDRGTDARTHPKGVATTAFMQPATGCAEHIPDTPLRAAEPCTCSRQRVWLSPKRVEWIEERHRAVLGSCATSQRWFEWLSASSRPANSLLCLSPEAQYLLTKVFNLKQQICANIYTASRSTDSCVFRSGTDGNLLDAAGCMYNPTGTFSVLPTAHERERIMKLAFEKWDNDEPVATAMVVPSDFWAGVQRRVAAG
eukprot:gene10131-24089_t